MSHRASLLLASCLNETGTALRYASDAMKGNRKVVLRAVEQNDDWALRAMYSPNQNDYITECMLQSKGAHICLHGRDAHKTLMWPGWALQYASEEMRGEPEVSLPQQRVEHHVVLPTVATPPQPLQAPEPWNFRKYEKVFPKVRERRPGPSCRGPCPQVPWVAPQRQHVHVRSIIRRHGHCGCGRKPSLAA
eukprot:5064674-Amphidinium_carterae.1